MKTNDSRSARIVGGGLIGTSIALALKSAGWQVEIEDLDPANQVLARDLIGESSTLATFDLIVVATPPSVVFEVLQREFTNNPDAKFIEISGLKSDLLLEVDKFPELSKRFLATHPMAGRESSGPESARGDLFQGRAWILVPTTLTEESVLSDIETIVESLGATTYLMEPEAHDSAISTISHQPQILSSLLGAALIGKPESTLSLAGQGLRDISRLAGSDPQLWSELLLANAEMNVVHLREYEALLQRMISALEENNLSEVTNILRDGKVGRNLIPGKHGAKNRDYTYLPIVIDDKPGQLAKIFHECEVADVNIEDLSIEHTPGQETGLITLALSENDATKLRSHLNAHGWLAHAPRKN